MLHFYLYKDRIGQWRWRIRAANNYIIADLAEGYVAKADCLHAINLVKNGALYAPIREF